MFNVKSTVALHIQYTGSHGRFLFSCIHLALIQQPLLPSYTKDKTDFFPEMLKCVQFSCKKYISLEMFKFSKHAIKRDLSTVAISSLFLSKNREIKGCCRSENVFQVYCKTYHFSSTINQKN